MSDLRAAVYVAPPTPFRPVLPNTKQGLWSPISCTLIYSTNEAVLVDTPITVKQTEDLIQWIETIAPNRKLSFIYITHGHGDHFFGMPLLLRRFPEAVPLATPETVDHMKQQLEEMTFNTLWSSRFPDQIYQPQIVAKALPSSLEFKLEDRWSFQAVKCGHTDTYDSTVLWVPALKLVVAGDVVYGQVHQMLMEANTRSKRHEWIKAIETVEALNPTYVVPGHKLAEEIDGVWHLASTKQYLVDYEKVLHTDPKDPAELVARIAEKYPERFNLGAVKLSAMGAFQVSKEARV